jgi:triosephosphate isomerase
LLFAVPFTLLEKAAKLAYPHGIRIAAQNTHFETSGAYTGEVSLAMLKDVGITATLVGHSERRQYFGETDETVNKKVRAALAQGFLTIACVGETLEERDGNQTAAVVSRQVAAVLEAVGPATLKDLVIAYEPVWAIGTGRTATSAQAEEVHAAIRVQVGQRFGAPAATALRLLYGGSANPSNIKELMAQPDVDGGLVGGASLKPSDFAAMVNSLR